MAIESILPSDSGKVAFEKTGRNFDYISREVALLTAANGASVFGKDDANEWRRTGLYRCSDTTSNRPSDASWGYIHVFGDSNCCNQFYIGMNNYRVLAQRTYNNNGWTQWETLVTLDMMNSKRFIQANPDTQNRDTPTKPSDYMLGLFTNSIKTMAAMGIPGGGFAHPIGINEWTDMTAGVYELIFAASKMYYRESINDNTWGQLHELATTRRIDIPSSSLLNGWTMWENGYGDNLVGCKTGKQVQLNGLLRCGVKTQNTLILTLPEELRPACNIIKNVSCYPYGTATIEIQSVGNVLVGNIGEDTLAISMGDVSYSTL